MPRSAQSINPATGKLVAEQPYISDAEAAAAAEQAHAAFLKWRVAPLSERTAPLRNAARLLREQKEALAQLMAQEMGKCVREGQAEVEKCARACEHYADHIAGYLQPEHIQTESSKSYVVLQPLGVILIVMPWNFPLWQVFRQAASGLSAGNTILLKHASNVFGCAAAIQRIMDAAGYPPGTFLNVPIAGGQCSTLLAHPRVRGVALTGSTPVGKDLAAHAGRLLKKAVLELGGADSYIILEDADIAAAARLCCAGRILNCGQSCIGAKRFIVLDAVYDAFLAAFAEAVAATKVGDPLDPATEMGPMVSVKAREDLHAQVTASVAAGATVAVGGHALPGPEGSAFYAPTVLVGVRPGMPAYDEELFGPVAAVIRVPDEVAAIEAANATPFGLGGAVFTQDVARGERLALEGLETGLAFVNDFVKSDPRLPFGGAKESGLGRECGAHGVREFCNVKTVVVK
eukprot:EG_transcript_8152